MGMKKKSFFFFLPRSNISIMLCVFIFVENALVAWKIALIVSTWRFYEKNFIPKKKIKHHLLASIDHIKVLSSIIMSVLHFFSPSLP
jgi:hypothetical protein